MRVGPRSSLLLITGLASAALAAFAQTPAPQFSVTVIVTNAITQPPQQVKAVRVSLEYLENGIPVTGAQNPTNPEGMARLLVSADAAQRGDLRIVVSGAGNLVVWQPADGQIDALPSTLKVSMLPKGSAALLGPAQIQAYLHRLLLRVNSLQKQVAAENTQRPAGQAQQQYLATALAEFAGIMGFTPDQVNQQVQIWAQNVQLQSAQATAEQRALAAFATRDYAAAAQAFDQAADLTQKQIDTEEAEAAALEQAQRKLVEKTRGALRQLLDEHQQAAGADQLNLQYHQATQTLESAAATAQAEFKKHAGDQGFHELWLQALVNAAEARRREGEVAPAAQSLPLLAQAASEFGLLATEYSALGDRPEAAAAQTDLGNALVNEGTRVGGDKAMALLDQAVQAFKQALAVRTKADLPEDWARTQLDLAIALMNEGTRASGDKAAGLFDQSVEACTLALEVNTKADRPLDWANTQLAIGSTRFDQAEFAPDDKALPLYRQSAEAYNLALEVYTKSDHPLEWAATQYDIAGTLASEGGRADAAHAMTLLDQAADAYKHALEIYTRAGMPQFWAMTVTGLGRARQNAAERATNNQAIALFDEAVQDYRQALEIYTKADLPQHWGRIQDDLGNALGEEAERTTGDKAMALLDQSAQAYRSELEVCSKTHLPQSWAAAQANLASTLMDEGERTPGDQALPLLDQALEADQHALEIYTKADFPRYWALIEMNREEAEFVRGQFDACLQVAGALGDDMLSAPLTLARDSLRLACAWGAGSASDLTTIRISLLSRTASAEAGHWDAGGAIRRLSSMPRFAQGRDSWIALFTAVQNGDGAGIATALHQLEPILQGASP